MPCHSERSEESTSISAPPRWGERPAGFFAALRITEWMMIGLLAAAPIFAADLSIGRVAPKPLFRDPVFDGAADPSIVYDRTEKKWLMFYTNRRANVPDLTAVTWVHGTPIGIAESADGAEWKYRGTVEFPKDIPGTVVEIPTYWAPAVLEHAGVYHMFVTIVPGI